MSHPHLPSVEVAPSLVVVVALHRQPATGRHGTHRDPQDVGRPRAAIHEISDEHQRSAVRRGHTGAGLLAHPFPGNAVAQFTKERSEEHTSELQSLMRITYAVF